MDTSEIKDMLEVVKGVQKMGGIMQEKIRAEARYLALKTAAGHAGSIERTLADAATLYNWLVQDLKELHQPEQSDWKNHLARFVEEQKKDESNHREHPGQGL